MDDKIRILIEEELAKTYQEHGPMLSINDGFAKLYEEYDESGDEWEVIQRQVKQLIYAIRKGYDPENIRFTLGVLHFHCVLAIGEIIQLGAMARKLDDLLKSLEAAK